MEVYKRFFEWLLNDFIVFFCNLVGGIFTPISELFKLTQIDNSFLEFMVSILGDFALIDLLTLTGFISILIIKIIDLVNPLK